MFINQIGFLFQIITYFYNILSSFDIVYYEIK